MAESVPRSCRCRQSPSATWMFFSSSNLPMKAGRLQTPRPAPTSVPARRRRDAPRRRRDADRPRRLRRRVVTGAVIFTTDEQLRLEAIWDVARSDKERPCPKTSPRLPAQPTGHDVRTILCQLQLQPGIGGQPACGGQDHGVGDQAGPVLGLDAQTTLRVDIHHGGVLRRPEPCRWAGARAVGQVAQRLKLGPGWQTRCRCRVGSGAAPGPARRWHPRGVRPRFRPPARPASTPAP
jgi:hypothetical protein